MFPSHRAPFPFISFSSPMMTLATLEISRSISYHSHYPSQSSCLNPRDFVVPCRRQDKTDELMSVSGLMKNKR